MKLTRHSRRSNEKHQVSDAAVAASVALPMLALLARVFELTTRQEGLSLTQYRALTVVAEAPRRAALLAELVSVTRPTLTNTIDVLVGRNFIARDPAPGDRRGIVLHVTPEGEAATTRIEEAFCRHLGRLAGEAEVHALFDALAGIASTVAQQAAESQVPFALGAADDLSLDA